MHNNNNNNNNNNSNNNNNNNNNATMKNSKTGVREWVSETEKNKKEKHKMSE